MASAAQRPKLVAIVGPTASGKSDLAMRIAKEFNGEIITADSRTLYKGMDIGTAKPTSEERQEVPHWGLDLVEPGKSFSAYKFKKYAEGAIKDIQQRNKLPILVGGTGLYVDSVLFDFGFVLAVDPKVREGLEKLSAESLQQIIKEKGYSVPQNWQNPRHLIRTIERKGQTGSQKKLRKDVIIVGLLQPDESLRKNISKRAEKLFAAGVIEETQELISKYGEEALRATGGIAHLATLRFIKGEISEEEAKELIQTGEWQYARRQRTWFRRNKFIQWFETPEDALVSVSQLLNN